MFRKVKTPRHEIEVECHYGYVNVSDVVVKKELFANMCKEGCRNYDCKYSCPPLSPEFSSYVKSKYLLVVLLRVHLDQLDYKEYHKLRLLNHQILIARYQI